MSSVPEAPGRVESPGGRVYFVEGPKVTRDSFMSPKASYPILNEGRVKMGELFYGNAYDASVYGAPLGFHGSTRGLFWQEPDLYPDFADPAAVHFFDLSPVKGGMAEAVDAWLCQTDKALDWRDVNREQA